MESAQTSTKPPTKPEAKVKHDNCFVSPETIELARKHGIVIPGDSVAINLIFWAQNSMHPGTGAFSIGLNNHWAGLGKSSGRIVSLSLLPGSGVVVAILRDENARISFSYFSNWISAEPLITKVAS